MHICEMKIISPNYKESMSILLLHVYATLNTKSHFTGHSHVCIRPVPGYDLSLPIYALCLEPDNNFIVTNTFYSVTVPTHQIGASIG